LSFSQCKKKQYLISAAANDLSKHAQLITGVRLKIVDDAKAESVTGPTVHIGETSFVNSRQLKLDQLDRDGIVIKRIDDNLILAGGSPRGTRNAVRLFLEDFCGVHWYAPGDMWRIVPEHRDIAIGPIDRREDPDFVSRSTTGIPHERWMDWNLTGYPERYHIAHNMGAIIPPSLYAEHPEYFPLIGGKRAKPKKSSSDWQPCLSNKDVQRLSLEAAKAFFDGNPDAELFSLAQNDNYGFCECPGCVKMNDGVKYDSAKHRNHSDLWVRFVNEICEQLGKTHPGKKIGFMAYQCGTFEAPSIKAHPNAVALVVNDRSRFHFDKEFRDYEMNYLRSWGRQCSTLSLHNWHYGKRFLIPRLELKSTAEFLRFARKMGARGYHGEEYTNWGMEGPKTYITTRLLWNVNADVDALLKEYCENCFAAASTPMLQFFNRLEQAWNEQPPQKFGMNLIPMWREDRRQFNVVTPEVVAYCNATLNEALRLADSQIVRDRVMHIRKSFRITDYFVIREASYNGLRAEEHTTAPTFAELVHVLNAMASTGRAVRMHIAAHIKDDPTTFCGGWPGIVPMQLYYCEFGSKLAAAVTREAVSKRKFTSQKELTDGLLKRLEELSKGVRELPPEDQGMAWKPFAERMRNYLTATAFVPALDKAPTIDGKIEPTEWTDAPVLTNYKIAAGKQSLQELAPAQTRTRIARDQDNLYLQFTCEDDIDHLVCTHDGEDTAVWQDDCVDFVILPQGQPKEKFYHYIINNKGVIYTEKGHGGSAWDSQAQIATGLDKKTGLWHLEVAIPWTDFGKTPGSLEFWRAQFARIDVEGVKMNLSSWAPSTKGFNNADDLGGLLFE